jgi:acetyltransferase
MKKESLKKFLNPKSIAIIGASDHEEKVGGILLKKAITSKVRIIPVNPKHEKLLGIKCYKNVLDYKGKIDLAVIAIPSLFVLGALNECGRKEIKNVMLISAGFSEIGNIKGEEELVKTAKEYGMRILGPNCFGVCNPGKNFDTTFSATMPNKGDIAFISQSGALWSYISDFTAGIADDKTIGFSGFVSLGNLADLEFNDFLEYYSKDKSTKSIILYIEKLKNGGDFIKNCGQCIKKGKKIYAVMAGSSLAGKEAAFSHTASLASDYRIYKGAFKQAGIILCDSLIEALEKISGKELMEKKTETIKFGKKVFILTNAGGAGALLADYLSQKGFEISGKPLDLLGTATGSDYFNALEKLKSDVSYDSLAIILTPQSMSETKKTAEVIAEFKNQTGKSIAALFLGKKSMAEANKIFEDNKVSYFNTLDEARRSLIP